jgi:hypothetical protein
MHEFTSSDHPPQWYRTHVILIWSVLFSCIFFRAVLLWPFWSCVLCNCLFWSDVVCSGHAWSADIVLFCTFCSDLSGQSGRCLICSGLIEPGLDGSGAVWSGPGWSVFVGRIGSGRVWCGLVWCYLIGSVLVRSFCVFGLFNCHCLVCWSVDSYYCVSNFVVFC